MKTFCPQCTRLQKEIDRFKALLSSHGIPWEEERAGQPESLLDQPRLSEKAGLHLSPEDKIALFRNLFRGRSDVYPVRWESVKGKSGYSPACSNEWRPGVCGKPRTKCGDCDQRQLLPVTDQVIYDHLAGHHTIGVYPLMTDETCYFLAVDFDGSDWREDARAFTESCRELKVSAALEISRSGQGAHVWIFFSEAVPAREARELGAALISHTCSRTRQLALSSYDRLFPNQDNLPKGGFGNLIALPLQKHPREQGWSVFVDDNLEPYPDQWAFLASMAQMSALEVESAISQATGGGHPLDVAFIAEENNTEPWKRPAQITDRLTGLLPASLKLTLASQIFIEKAPLTQPLANRLIRLAAFQNPEFYKAQAMHLPVWNKPHIIGCAENFPLHIGLPRGCLEPVRVLLARHDIKIEIHDERVTGSPIKVKFTGVLRADQKSAFKAMLNHEVGVLFAPTAFGKTVTASAIIARRRVSTLILVHRTELLRQWQERLRTFLDIPKGGLGTLVGGKEKLSGQIDIAVMQSLSRRQDLANLLDRYGQIIVDECHHLSAFSFETIMKQAKSRYVLGLTATPVRRDGHHPIIFMQCGPIRHSATRPETAPTQLEIWPNSMKAPAIPPDAKIQDVFRALAIHDPRNQRIAQDILTAYKDGRKILVLSERTDHLNVLREAMGEVGGPCWVLHGRLSKKQRTAILSELNELDEAVPRVLLATGRLIGEGFDHPPLDTLVLAMPISWKGTLQQYAGRLHRGHASKRDVRIYDYIEHDHPQLARMWDKRLRGYRAMGYELRTQ
jgi:superfamily II DNA or RNA helicase